MDETTFPQAIQNAAYYIGGAWVIAGIVRGVFEVIKAWLTEGGDQ